VLGSHRRRVALGIIALGLTATSIVLSSTALLRAGVPAVSAPSSAGAVWTEEPWPFAIDQWGTGQAFRCISWVCGADLHLYLRAKIGFCRCATGVSEDDEIDRVGDTELLGPNYKPVSAGQAVNAGILRGRARLFRIDRAFRSSILALTVALANKCDAVVAIVTSADDISSTQEAIALDFLRSETVQRWAKMNTGFE